MPLRRTSFALITLVALAGCRDGDLWSSRGDLVVDEEAVEFPLTWLGHPTERTISVRNTSRAPQSFGARVDSPFSLEASNFEVPGGGVVELRISFAPTQQGAHTAELVLELEASEPKTMPLHGDARIPPACTPTRDCVASQFDPTSGECVEEALPNGASCGAFDACIIDGQCNEGVCVGTQRDCDDANACTQDGCDPVQGCVHLDTSAQCPDPVDPCRVAYCDPLTGCGTQDVQDGIACGPSDCIRANVCLDGVCRNVPVPEGGKCGGTSPCQGEGVCQNQVCVQPDPAPLTPVWTYSNPDPTVTLNFQGAVDLAENLYWTECTPNRAFPCSLVSATRDGVERWRTSLPGVDAHRYASAELVTQGMIITRLNLDSLEARRLSDGQLVWTRNLGADYGPQLTSQPPGSADYAVYLGALAVDGRGQLVVPLEGFDMTPGSYVSSLLVALDLATGATAFTAPLHGYYTEASVDELGRIYTSGTLPNPTGPETYELSALGPSGNRLWSHEKSDGRTLSTYGGSLLASGRLALQTIDGAPRWVDSSALGASALLDGTSIWTRTWRPGSGDADLVQRDASTGSVQWTYSIPATAWAADMVLTDKRSTLMTVMAAHGPLGAPWSIEEVDDSGSRRFSCEFPPDLVQMLSVALLDERFVVQGYDHSSGKIVAFDVPGQRLAKKGWVMPRGNPQRTGAPR